VLKVSHRLSKVIDNANNIVSSSKRYAQITAFSVASIIWNNVYAEEHISLEYSVHQLQQLEELQSMWIPTDEFNLYLTGDDFDYYVWRLSQPEIWPLVWKVLLDIEDVTWMRFWWLDIPVLTNLVIMRNSWDPLLWHDEYQAFLDAYSALRQELIPILTYHQLNPHGENI